MAGDSIIVGTRRPIEGVTSRIVGGCEMCGALIYLADEHKGIKSPRYLCPDCLLESGDLDDVVVTDETAKHTNAILKVNFTPQEWVELIKSGKISR